MMSYGHSGFPSMPGMELGMPAAQQPIYPGVRIGGSDMPGAFTLQVLHPNGQTINVEIGDLTRPLSAASSTQSNYLPSSSGPVREGLSRPSSDHMRRRSASVASTSGMEYDSFGVGHGGGSHYHPQHNKPLLDRVEAMNLNGRYNNNSSPMPDLTRSDPPPSFGRGRGGYNNDSFSRPASRMSNRSYNQQPYARPHSSNSFRSNGSFQSNGYRPRGNDGFYPKYTHDGKTNVGSYPVLPIDRRRPFFTPVPEDPVAGILVKNIAAECTLADINSTFLDYGKLTCIELIERCPPTIVVYMEYESKDDADMAIQQTNGVVADNSVLETTHVNPKVVYRPHKTSTDPAFRLTIENGLITKKINPISSAKGKEVEGGRTPLASLFASKSPTPHPVANDSGRTSRSGRDSREEGWGDKTPPAKAAGSSGWGDTDTSYQTTVSDDGWGAPAAKPDKDGNGWRGTTVREESSDIDLE